MNLAICSLASGSSGNCYLIKSNRATILADAGISARQVGLRFEALGLSAEDIDAVLITHEHSDHTQGIKALSKSERVKFFLNEKTLQSASTPIDEEKIQLIKTGQSFGIEDIKVSSFRLSHDAADPCGYSFESAGKRISIVTDTGIVTEEIFEAVKDSDILVLESNHDENILKMGPYPWFLKQRILSDHGHLSNDAAAELVLRILKDRGCGAEENPKEVKALQVLLAHLSKENNFPEMALATVNNILEAEGIKTGKTVKINVLSRTEASPLFGI